MNVKTSVFYVRCNFTPIAVGLIRMYNVELNVKVLKCNHNDDEISNLSD